MSRTKQLWLIVAVVLAITSATSHIVARAVHIRLQAVSPLSFGETNRPIEAIAAGSSLTFYGINWSEVARASGMRVQGWAVPSGSVVEMEVLQQQVPAAHLTFLGVSLLDLNENYLSDFRADVVPLMTAVQSLWEVDSTWEHWKRVLSQYPLRYIRAVFPTAGRSTAVMVGARQELATRLSRRTPIAAEERAVISAEANPHQESITAWPEARRLRNLADLRAGAKAALRFDGQKRRSLRRFLERGSRDGRAVLIVIPESATYRTAIATPEAREQFEKVLAETRTEFPNLICVRLDQLPELESDQWYWDLGHLNARGQAIATRALLAQLAVSGVFR